MIPKIIHYVWLGDNEPPKVVKKCIKSWKEKCPDYEIKKWNESNFDINSNRYTKEAYKAKKYAFVSDYIRLYALYTYGGIYMDTDVEVYKNFDDILDNHCIFGFEEKDYIATSFMAAEKKNEFIKEFMNGYENESFKNNDGTLNQSTNVERLTSLLVSKGLKRNGKIQSINQIKIYPKEYFSPYDYINCVNEKTNNSYCIHKFYVSWMPWYQRVKKNIKSILVRVVGKKNLIKLRKIKDGE